jgi:integrative and conjugative element protein (TIGR02256 family)
MDGLQFWSDDRRFGLEISSRYVSRMLEQCAHSKAREVGGILVGYYTAAQDCAVVRAISGPPPDSRSGRNWFHRGVVGLQEFVDRIWYVDRHYYLGEWHFHPDASPVPSHQDAKELKRIASSIPYRCPEPVLFIIGGNPTQGWITGAYVFPRGEEAIELVLKAGAPELITVE